MPQRGLTWLLAGMIVSAPGFAAQPVLADIIVLESDIAGLEPGQAYGDSTAISLAEGQTLSVMLPSGETRNLKGPAELKVADLTNGVPIDKSVWETVTGILQRGGASDEEAGAVRGFGSDMSSEFSWSVIPAFASGSLCVDQNAALSIARPPLGDVETMTIADADGAKVPVRWPSDGETVAWPIQLPPIADKTYIFMVPSLPATEVTLRFMVPPLPDESRLIPSLVKLGCTFQVESWLNARVLASMP